MNTDCGSYLIVGNWLIDSEMTQVYGTQYYQVLTTADGSKLYTVLVVKGFFIFPFSWE